MLACTASSPLAAACFFSPHPFGLPTLAGLVDWRALLPELYTRFVWAFEVPVGAAAGSPPFGERRRAIWVLLLLLGEPAGRACLILLPPFAAHHEQTPPWPAAPAQSCPELRSRLPSRPPPPSPAQPTPPPASPSCCSARSRRAAAAASPKQLCTCWGGAATGRASWTTQVGNFS